MASICCSPLPQHGKLLEHLLETLHHMTLAARAEGAEPQVLPDAQVREDLAAFGNVGNAETEDGVRRAAVDRPAFERDATRRGRQQARDGAKGG